MDTGFRRLARRCEELLRDPELRPEQRTVLKLGHDVSLQMARWSRRLPNLVSGATISDALSVMSLVARFQMEEPVMRTVQRLVYDRLCQLLREDGVESGTSIVQATALWSHLERRAYFALMRMPSPDPKEGAAQTTHRRFLIGLREHLVADVSEMNMVNLVFMRQLQQRAEQGASGDAAEAAEAAVVTAAAAVADAGPSGEGEGDAG